MKKSFNLRACCCGFVWKLFLPSTLTDHHVHVPKKQLPWPLWWNVPEERHLPGEAFIRGITVRVSSLDLNLNLEFVLFQCKKLYERLWSDMISAENFCDETVLLFWFLPWLQQEVNMGQGPSEVQPVDYTRFVNTLLSSDHWEGFGIDRWASWHPKSRKMPAVRSKLIFTERVRISGYCWEKGSEVQVVSRSTAMTPPEVGPRRPHLDKLTLSLILRWVYGNGMVSGPTKCSFFFKTSLQLDTQAR